MSPREAVATAPEHRPLARHRAAVAAFDPLVAIRPGGTRGDGARSDGPRPLFLAHPLGGNVLCYQSLARHLPDDQPLYALRAAGADPGSAPADTMAELAASYLAALRRVQPAGPYLIAGWSFGGLVAFEMARQLRQAGEEVSDLVIIDTVIPNPDKLLGAPDDAVLTWFFRELLWLERGGDFPVEAVPGELRTREEKFEFIAERAARLGVLPAGSAGAVRRLFEVYLANARAAVSYRPGVLDRDIILLRAAAPLPEKLRGMRDAVGGAHRDPFNGWRGRTSAGLWVIEVPGDHLSMMEEPHVKSLATVITNQIGR